MQQLRLWFLLAVLCSAAVFASEDEATLATARKEYDALKAQLQSEQERVKSLTLALQEIEDDAAQMDTEIQKSRGREAKALDTIRELKGTVKELEEKIEGCVSCQADLEISKGAEKQLETELTMSFARVQILAAEIKQLKELTEELQSKVDEKEGAVTVALKKAATLQVELEALKEKLSQGGVSISAVFAQVRDASSNQLVKFGPYWQSFKAYISPSLDVIASQPYVQQFLTYGKKGLEHSTRMAEMASKYYTTAAPFVSQAYETATRTGSTAIQKINEVYTVARPVIQDYSSRAYEASSWALVSIKDLSIAFYHSHFMTEGRRLSFETIEELKHYVQGQMQQVQSLQPFAKKEYVVCIVYTMLSIPPLFLTGLLISCLSRGHKKPSAPPTAAVSASKKTKQAHKKSKNKAAKEKKTLTEASALPLEKQSEVVYTS